MRMKIFIQSTLCHMENWTRQASSWVHGHIQCQETTQGTGRVQYYKVLHSIHYMHILGDVKSPN